MSEDPEVRIAILHDWLSDADVLADRLRAHLRAVLEIAHTWRPPYATVMDLQTLALAEKEAGDKTKREWAGSGEHR